MKIEYNVMDWRQEKSHSETFQAAKQSELWQDCTILEDHQIEGFKADFCEKFRFEHLQAKLLLLRGAVDAATFQFQFSESKLREIQLAITTIF